MVVKKVGEGGWCMGLFWVKGEDEMVLFKGWFFRWGG